MKYYCLMGSDSLVFFLRLNKPAEGTRSPVVGVVNCQMLVLQTEPGSLEGQQGSLTMFPELQFHKLDKSSGDRYSDVTITM